jgi:hypothetical protein
LDASSGLSVRRSAEDRPVNPILPRWASWTFLLYAGGLTILGSSLALLSEVSDEHGDAAFTGWALLLFVATAAVALYLRRDGGHPIAAGIAAVIAVGLFASFVGALYEWTGWLDEGPAFRGFDLARLTLALLTLVAALVALRLFRFPLLVLVLVVSSWYFLTDLLSGGGNWSATVTFLIGIVFLTVAASLDVGGHHPYAFWLHVGAGLTIGGSLVYFLHDGDFEWALIALGGLLYIALASRFGRSSWAVLGAVGILLSAAHYATGETAVSLVPLFGLDSGSNGLRGPIVFAIAGLVLMLLGGLLARRVTRQRVAV